MAQKETVRRYWLAFALTAIFMLAGRLLLGWISYNPIIFAITAVIATAWLFGRGPGFFASFVIVFMARPLFYPAMPLYTVGAADILRLVLYLLLTGFVSYLVGARRSAELKLLQSNAELDRRVQERTAELAATNLELRRANEALEAERTRVESANEALRRANRDLEHFAYSASHDLQEPIRNVAIFSEIVSQRYRDQLDEAGQTYLNFMREGAERMGTLVRGLLDYTRIANESDETVREADPNRAMERALQNLAGVVAETGAEVIQRELPTQVRAHEVHLQQVLQNLIGNALKYRAPINPRVEVGADRDGAQWRFWVKDNGIGIDPEYREFVFGLFKRLHGNGEYTGTGLGLPICRRIVEQYGGRIWVESQRGMGSTFYFTLPGAEAPGQAKREALAAEDRA